MGKNEFSNIGEEIRDAVEDAIDSMDFKQLNKTISDTVSDAVDEVRKQFTQTTRQSYTRRYERTGRQRRCSPGHTSGQDHTPHRQKAASEQAGSRADSKPQPGHDTVRSKLRVHPPSRTSGILLTVFGSIGLGLSLVSLLALLTSALFVFTVSSVTWVLASFLLAAAGVSGILLCRGNTMRARLARLKLYLLEANEKTYCSIRDLVGRTGKQEKYIIKDLKRMIKSGILPHAHLDDKNTCLMLDDETYHQYLQSMESLKQRTAIQHVAPAPEPERQDDRMNQVTAEGREYLKALREANEAIPGEVISAKLYQLETIIEKIFDVVDKHPDQVDDLERFMEYYLPTTMKLVNAYRDFDSVGIAGDNISMAKADVEETLDTINKAFEQLLDGLYQDEAFDVSTDASVLQAMLKKDGYTGSDFDRRDES